MKRIVIAAATKRELSILIDAAGGERQSQTACGEYYHGAIGSFEIIAAVTGLGKVNTAMGTTFLLNEFKPELLISTGCGGAYPGSGLAVGDIVVATSEIYADEGVETPSGWASLEIIGIPLYRSSGSRFFNEFPLTGQMRARAVSVAASLGVNVKEGKFATVSTCSGTDSRAQFLAGRFGVVCENMEGAAAAHVALCHGVDCLEIRGISNIVEARDLSRWNIDLASENVQKLLIQIIKAL